MNKVLFLAVLTVFCLSSFLVAQTEEERIQKLEQLIDNQQQRIDQLQEHIQTSPAKADSIENSDIAEEGPEVGYEARGFFLRVPNVELYLSGMIQMGLAVFENDTPDNNSFYPNGVSLATDVYFYQNWHGRVEVNFHKWGTNVFQSGSGVVNGDGVQLWDAYIEYLHRDNPTDNPAIALRVGQTHVPFTMEGQYGPNQGVAIWGSPYIVSWSHGRDPGLMVWGVLSDIFEYKLSVHNGEGATRLNGTDDMLLAGGFRIYPFQKSQNANTFFHVGAIRSRDDKEHRFDDIASASLVTPWGRPVFDDVFQNCSTQGWRTGIDAAFRFDMDMGENNADNLRVEAEFMYITWERDLDSVGRLPFLIGYGFSWSMAYRMNLNPEIPGEGIIPLFTFSYSDVDNKKSDNILGDVYGQRVYTYTFGLGYAFNKHISAQFNWVIVNLDEKDLYNGNNGNAARNDRSDGSDDLEHAWFLQFTAAW
jgi:hypothetical protein